MRNPCPALGRNTTGKKKQEVVKNTMSRDSFAINYLANLYILTFRQLM
jgi:hypothetical protein